LKKEDVKVQIISFVALVTESGLGAEEFYPAFMSTGLMVAEARSHFGFIDRLVDTLPWRSDHRDAPNKVKNKVKSVCTGNLVITLIQIEWFPCKTTYI
jgi:hypothetical protein